MLAAEVRQLVVIRHFKVSASVINRLRRRYRETENVGVADQGWCHITTERESRYFINSALHQCAARDVLANFEQTTG